MVGGGGGGGGLWVFLVPGVFSVTVSNWGGGGGGLGYCTIKPVLCR